AISSNLVDELFSRVNALPAPTVPAIRPIRREFSRRLAGASAGEVIALVQDIVDRSLLEGAREVRWMGFEIVHYHRPALESLDLPTLETLGRTLNSWDSVDVFALYLSGPAWRNDQIGDRDVQSWARSENLWWRRVALVSTVALNLKARGGTGDVARTMPVCRMLADDGEDMVVKALSWALRVAVQHDREAVESFLAEYEHCLAARVKREVATKLSTGRKSPRRPAKV
ncbi:MAG: DNA alkylation repair protein, partial [Chloroflexi bacterium]|nr:DNA alkylation repair protein [Chloroflexota bacterium]